MTTTQKLTTLRDKLDEAITATADVLDEVLKSDHLDQSLARLRLLRSKVGQMVERQAKREETEAKERLRLQAKLAEIQAQLALIEAA